MTVRRIDRIQVDVVTGLRRAGADIQHLHMVGHGCPDLLVIFRGSLFLLELKSPGGRLTPLERCWHDRWPGPVHIVHSLDEALVAIGAEVVR